MKEETALELGVDREAEDADELGRAEK